MYYSFKNKGKELMFDVFDYDIKQTTVGKYEGYLPNIIVVLEKDLNEDFIVTAVDYIEDLEKHLSYHPLNMEFITASKIMFLQHPPVSEQNMDVFKNFLEKLVVDLKKLLLNKTISASDLTE